MSSLDPNFDTVRRRIISGLFVASGVAVIPGFAMFTIVNVLGAELLHGETWSGLPGTFILFGSAAAAAVLSNYMARAGRRRGLVAGYVVGAFASILAVASVSARSFVLLMVALLLFGFGNSAIQLSRYAAADVTSIEGRGKAISLITWSSVLGALIGPNLVGSSGRLAESLGLPSLSGPFLLCVAGFVIAAALISARLRPDPMDVARSLGADTPVGERSPEARPLSAILGSPQVQIAIAAMAIGQLVMVLVMSMTAVHMRAHDHSWGTVGFVISAHLLGMFALSPISGWASDRFGRVPVILAGAITLIAATLIAASQPNSSRFLTSALFLLGFGWNLANVSGSALLTDSVLPHERARMQGVGEVLTGGSSAVAGGASGVILGAFGFANLSLFATVLIVVMLGLVLTRLRPARVQPGTASG